MILGGKGLKIKRFAARRGVDPGSTSVGAYIGGNNLLLGALLHLDLLSFEI